jgi:hypothetical protein
MKAASRSHGRTSGGSRPGRLLPLVGILGLAASGSAWAHPPAEHAKETAAKESHAGQGSEALGSDAHAESMHGHGAISIAYQNTLVNGFLKHDGNPRDIGTVRIHGINLGGEYHFSDHWSVHAAIPFVQSRYLGPAPHCPTRVPEACQAPGVRVPSPEHPESRFLDDGSAHGAWQDWHLGVAYHTVIGNYQLTPSMTLQVPSHNYPFFAQSAVGQNLVKLEVGAELAHQFEFTNLYYRTALYRVFVEKTLGISVDHYKLDVELGWFINEDVSVKTFATWTRGKGITTDDPRLAQSEIFYHHDQISRHEYFNVGLGMDYQINDRYTLSTTAQTLIWGNTVYNLQYAFGVQLSRAF